MGTLVREQLGKDVAVAHCPILSVSRDRTVASFFRRYQRWATIQRYSVGPLRYVALVALNPLIFTLAALVLSPTRFVYAAVLACWFAKALLEAVAGFVVHRQRVGVRQLIALPLKDALLFVAWIWGLGSQEVSWRGTRLAVRPGTRLEPIASNAFDESSRPGLGGGAQPVP